MLAGGMSLRKSSIQAGGFVFSRLGMAPEIKNGMPPEGGIPKLTRCEGCRY
jgi:hypothetical protein